MNLALAIAEGVIVAIIGVIAAPVAAAWAWLLNRSRNRSDVSRSIAEASGHAVDTMERTMMQLNAALEQTRRELEFLKEQNNVLSTSIGELQRQNQILKVENQRLADEVRDLRGRIDPFQ